MTSPDGLVTIPNNGSTLSENEVSYADLLPCVEYSARLDGNFQGITFNLAEQEINVISPVRDLSMNSEDIQETKMTWNGSKFVENNRVNVTINTSGDVVTAEVRIILQT